MTSENLLGGRRSVFLTQKKKKQQQNQKHSCASPHNCLNGPFILGPCSVCLPLGSYEACEPTYFMVPKATFQGIPVNNSKQGSKKRDQVANKFEMNSKPPEIRGN